MLEKRHNFKSEAEFSRGKTRIFLGKSSAHLRRANKNNKEKRVQLKWNEKKMCMINFIFIHFHQWNKLPVSCCSYDEWWRPIRRKIQITISTYTYMNRNCVWNLINKKRKIRSRCTIPEFLMNRTSILITCWEFSRLQFTTESSCVIGETCSWHRLRLNFTKTSSRKPKTLNLIRMNYIFSLARGFLEDIWVVRWTRAMTTPTTTSSKKVECSYNLRGCELVVAIELHLLLTEIIESVDTAYDWHAFARHNTIHYFRSSSICLMSMLHFINKKWWMRHVTVPLWEGQNKY